RRMRIQVVDVGGNFIGPTLGLLTLGHDVEYFHNGPLRPVLAEAVAARTDTPDLAADLVVVAASFGDEMRTRAAGEFGDHPTDPDDPFLSTLNPDQARIRADWLTENLPHASQSVLVDMADDSHWIAPELCELGDVRLKREWRPTHLESNIEAFPFLYHALVLEAEVLDEMDHFLRPPDARERLPCLRFAGAVEHARYAGRRRRWLEQLASLEPNFRVEVVGPRLPAVQTWEALQHGYAGIYLEGTGSLCFRLHEYAALGVPTLAFGFDPSHLPAAWRGVLAGSTTTVKSPVEMLQFYRDHYMPIRAAEWLLEHATSASVR
ncbi:MAG: hypothetical protein KDB80_08390, partial [Planctomycetes bacterium]|nr:hypothetical protein [Planctomycetota bacterium]